MYFRTNFCGQYSAGEFKKKLLRAMRLTAILLLATCLFANAEEGNSQKLSISGKNLSLKEVFSRIKKTTGYVFFYEENVLDKAHNVDINLKNADLKQVLDWCMKNQPLSYKIVGSTIVISNGKTGENRALDLEETLFLLEAEPPTISVKGKVVYDNGQPAAGISVSVKGTTNGTFTNDNGLFVLPNTNDKAILVFTGVNVVTKEVPVNGRNDLGTISLDIKATESNQEVVVSTGFQTISKERATGAFGKVTSEILEKRPTANLANSLVGQIAGLVADANTGFVIRGRSSLSGSTADRRPLLVVDGFPIEGGFESINPNDVKSVDVLKDAAATSIYGARAANGVIVVITKGTGPKGRMNVNYSGFVSVSENIDLDHYMNMVDSKGQLAFEDNFYNTFKGTTTIRDPYTSTTFRGRLGEYFTLLAERDKGNITQDQFDATKSRMLNGNYKDDYYKYLLRNQVTQQHNLTISGASDRNAYKFSFLYDNDKTSLQRNNNDRYMLGFTNIFDISKAVKYTFNTNLTFFNQASNGVNLGYAKTVTAPWTKLVDEDGNYTRQINAYYEPMAEQMESRLPFSLRYNALEESHLRDNLYKGQDIRIRNEFEINLAKGLTVRPMFQYEYRREDNRSIYDERSNAVRNYASIISTLNTTTNTFQSQIPGGGIYRYNGGQERQAYKGRIQADYLRTFANKHEVAVAAGGEIITSKTEVAAQDVKFGYNKEGLNYALFDYNVNRTNIWNENVDNSPPSFENQNLFNRNAISRQALIYNERYTAGYLNGSYTFDRRYTGTFSMRTDASNYISRNNRERFSPFYSVGARWNIGNEKFMEKVKFVDRLAMRFTYGSTGNAAGKTSILPFSVYSTGSPNAETGNYVQGSVSGRQNDLLTWEKTYSTNLAVDFSLWKGKLFGSVDLYNRLSQDLLTQVQTSYVLWSSPSLTINAAEVLNRGVEITLGTNLNITKKLTWDANFNFDYNNNEVLDYNFLATRITNYSGGTTFIEGLPIDRIIANKIVGTTREGFYIMEKKNGELVIENSTANSFAGFSTISNTIPGINPKDDDRLYYMGRSIAPVNAGFTNTFNWKGLSLMSVFYGRFGHLVRRDDTYVLFSQGAMNYSATAMAALNPVSDVATTNTGIIAPTRANLATYTQAASTRAYYSDVTLQKASHIRLNEIYLGYEFPNSLLRKTRNIIRSFSIYTQARNLGVIWTSNEDKIDPEFKPGTLKPVKTFTFGVRLGL